MQLWFTSKLHLTLHFNGTHQFNWEKLHCCCKRKTFSRNPNRSDSQNVWLVSWNSKHAACKFNYSLLGMKGCRWIGCMNWLMEVRKIKFSLRGEKTLSLFLSFTLCTSLLMRKCLMDNWYTECKSLFMAMAIYELSCHTGHFAACGV